MRELRSFLAQGGALTRGKSVFDPSGRTSRADQCPFEHPA